jgi:catechol 2,3-dioxygenase-like lactoylglutathione lyase family enzyme
MTVTTLFAGLAVTDLDAAEAFYERLLGGPPDMVPNEDELCWQATGPAWLYLVRDAERAGRGLAALFVDDLDAVIATLAEADVECDPITIVGGGVRHTRVSDPDGNRITLGQVPPAR